jgi:hypothetical protein
MVLVLGLQIAELTGGRHKDIWFWINPVEIFTRAQFSLTYMFMCAMQALHSILVPE